MATILKVERLEQGATVYYASGTKRTFKTIPSTAAAWLEEHQSTREQDAPGREEHQSTREQDAPGREEQNPRTDPAREEEHQSTREDTKAARPAALPITRQEGGHTLHPDPGQQAPPITPAEVLRAAWDLAQIIGIDATLLFWDLEDWTRAAIKKAPEIWRGTAPARRAAARGFDAAMETTARAAGHALAWGYVLVLVGIRAGARAKARAKEAWAFREEILQEAA